MRSLGFVCALAAVLAGSARAQTPVDSTPHRFRVDVAALKPARFVYDVTLERDSLGTAAKPEDKAPLGVRTVVISEALYAGAPAWVIVETRTAPPSPAVDSVVLSPDFQPLHWGSTLGLARLAIEFVGDSLFGGASAPTGRRSVAGRTAAGVIVNAGMLETALSLLPLGKGWQDSTTTLSVTLAGAVSVPAQLLVTGEESVVGVDCWVVEVSAPPARGVYWVGKRDHRVIRSVQTVPSRPGFVVISQLR